MCVRESGASSSAKHQSNTQHQATLSAGAACFFVAPAGKRSSCKRESLVLGMLANLRLHERPKHLHSATMCSAVHQPFEDGDDTSCGPACIVAFNAKIQADYDESLAWLEVDEEPRTRAGATLCTKIPVDAIIELWREQSSHGRYSKQFFSSLESLLEASGDSLAT